MILEEGALKCFGCPRRLIVVSKLNARSGDNMRYLYAIYNSKLMITCNLIAFKIGKIASLLYQNPGRVIFYENVSPFLELTVKKP